MNSKPLDDASEPVHGQGQNAIGSAQATEAEQMQDTGTTEAATVQPSPPVRLTRRQAQVLRLVATGLTNQQIANHMGLSIHTVETHLHIVYKKLKVTTRGSAVRYAMEHELG